MLFKILYFDNERHANKEYDLLKFATVPTEYDNKDEALLKFYRTLVGGSRSKVIVLDAIKMDEYDHLELYEITVTGGSNEAEVYYTRTFNIPAFNKGHAELMAYRCEAPSELVGVCVTKVVNAAKKINLQEELK